MKTTFQKIECKIPSATDNTVGSAQFSGNLRQDYAKCVGILFMNADKDTLTAKVNIAGREVLPTGTNVSLFNFNGNYGRDEAKLDLSGQDIPARSSEYLVDFENPSKEEITITMYFELKSE